MKSWASMLRLAVFSGLLVMGACAAPPQSYHPRHPIPPEQVSHELWDAVLVAHVRDGHVDYPAIAVDARLAAYLEQLDRIDPAGLRSRDERLALWINAYNAFAVKGILDGYSPRTLLGRYRYFIGRDYGVGGERINLYDLERKIIIPDFHEPRIHFAIVCASYSCPRLPSEAYVPERLNEQLDLAARRFVNDRSRNRLDRDRKVAALSQIFEWYEEDFAAEAGSLPAYIRRYVADPAVAAELERYRLEFIPYDWSLNGSPLSSD